MIDESENGLLTPLVESWLGVIEQSVRAKQPFSEVASMCQKFYAGLTGFMWKSNFRNKYIGDGIKNPKFQVTIAKAFELVAIFGPSLYWKYPNRTVTRYERPKLYPDVLGDPNDPYIQQMWSFLDQQIQSDERASEMRNSVMQMYLNYAQREQYGGGLESHSRLAITDALVKGRGCLWTESYKYPDSGTSLTGSFWDSVDNLLIDPDCTDPTLVDAQFVIRKHTNSTWDVEKRFGLRKGSLREKGGSLESGKSQGGLSDQGMETDRRNGKAKDLLVWYEIFSKCGVGTRLNKGTAELEKNFDEVVGDHAYICVAKNIKFPLNAPPKRFKQASDEEVRAMFDWPVPYWRDNRWPVSVLDFYQNTESCWPIAPIAPGLGELICINILASVVTSQTYENSRQVVAYLASAAQDVEKALKSTDDLVVVKLNDSINKSIQECIQYLQRPEINMDVWKTIDWLSTVFDKRTGLSELLYSMNPGGAQSRSAEDAKIKQANASVRPEDMANRVARHQTEAAELEKLCAYWTVKSTDIRPLLGVAGSMAWEKYIENEDPEIVFREMRCMVGASEVKKPNKEREAGNMQSLAGYLLPELSKHADATGDTGPLNSFIATYGEAIDQDTESWMMGDRVPMPPPPEVQQMQQAQMDLEMQKLQADVQKSQVDAEAKQAESAMAGEQMAMQLQMDAAKGEQELSLKREEAQLKLQADAAAAQQQMEIEQVKAQASLMLETAKQRQQMELQRESAEVQQAQQGVQFFDKLTQSRMNHVETMRQSREKAKVQSAAAKKKPAKKG